MMQPSGDLIFFAPGYLVGPLITNFLSFSIFRSVTTSGKVKFMAMERGTPNSSTCKFGSGDITLLALKSTLLPIKLPRTRPSFPFNLA